MAIIDDVLKANEAYARQFALGDLPIPPARKLAIVACMDARLTVEQILGLRTGDAHIIRNAGGIVTEDALRSLLISHHLLGTQEFMIMNHTDCGMLTFRDEELRTKLQQATGTATVAPAHFYAFPDLAENVRQQIQKVKSHPWIPAHIPVRGFIYDVKTGRLDEVVG
jgi:carbonic anhydrase